MQIHDMHVKDCQYIIFKIKSLIYSLILSTNIYYYDSDPVLENIVLTLLN